MTDTKRINLALQGGGSHGAYTWGVLDALIEDGRLEVEAVSGTRNRITLPYRPQDNSIRPFSAARFVSALVRSASGA